MTITILLKRRFLLLAAIFTIGSATPPLAHYYDDVSDTAVSRMSGVYRVVDETSCACRLIFIPCPVVVQKHEYEKKTAQCPFMSRYCCDKATLINLTDAAQKLPPATSPTQETTTETKPLVQPTQRTPQQEITPEEQATRQTPSSACSCTTKPECQMQLPVFKDMPKYNIKTTIRCKDPKHIVCCFGKVIPPRRQRSPERPKGTRGISKTPESTNIWEALENLMAYFNSEE